MTLKDIHPEFEEKGIFFNSFTNTSKKAVI